MDSAMRDLEQIRERNDDSEGRPLALVGLLIVVTIGLVLAMGSLVGWTDEAEAAEEDPLARLDRASGLTAADEEDDADLEAPAVERRALRFHEALAPGAERADVAAARAAAAAELAHPDPLDHLPPISSPEVARALPAAVAAGHEADSIARVALADPLVASSLPRVDRTPVAAGREGEYTVQVISYDSPEGAEAFGAGLRARGHHAFVVRAEVDGRGTVYRVRIGPFENMRAAEAYRREFERTERMNTIVVRRREDATGPA